MCDILLRGGLTVEDLVSIGKAVAEAHYLLHNHAKLANGHDLETEEDYAIHYREMEADLDEIEQRDLNKGILPNVHDRRHEREKQINASNPAAAALRGFEGRQIVAQRKRRAETRLMRLQIVESEKLLERNDPSARIAHDVVPAVDVSAVTNESNNV